MAKVGVRSRSWNNSSFNVLILSIRILAMIEIYVSSFGLVPYQEGWLITTGCDAAEACCKCYVGVFRLMIAGLQTRVQN
jgi:hypothetical protein